MVENTRLNSKAIWEVRAKISVSMLWDSDTALGKVTESICEGLFGPFAEGETVTIGGRDKSVNHEVVEVSTTSLC